MYVVALCCVLLVQLILNIGRTRSTMVGGGGAEKVQRVHKPGWNVCSYIVTGTLSCKTRLSEESPAALVVSSGDLKLRPEWPEQPFALASRRSC